MTKITNELLEDYAMLYPRIECVKMRFRNKLMTPIEAINHKTHDFGINIEYIQLRSIESITEEEFELLKFDFSGVDDLSYYLNNDFLLNFNVVEYLRKLGIATPTTDKEFNIISVDELIESGKLKLI